MTDHQKRFIGVLSITGLLLFGTAAIAQYRALTQTRAYGPIPASAFQGPALIVSHCQRSGNTLQLAGQAPSDLRPDHSSPITVIYQSRADQQFYRSGRTYVKPIAIQVTLAEVDVGPTNEGTYPYTASIRLDTPSARAGGDVFIVTRQHGADAVHRSQCTF